MASPILRARIMAAREERMRVGIKGEEGEAKRMRISGPGGSIIELEVRSW